MHRIIHSLSYIVLNMLCKPFFCSTHISPSLCVCPTEAASSTVVRDVAEDSSSGGGMPSYAAYMDTGDAPHHTSSSDIVAATAMNVFAGGRAVTLARRPPPCSRCRPSSRCWSALGTCSCCTAWPDWTGRRSAGEARPTTSWYCSTCETTPAALTSIDSTSFTLSGLSDFNAPSGGGAMEQVSNDLNVGAQERCAGGGGGTAGGRRGRGSRGRPIRCIISERNCVIVWVKGWFAFGGAFTRVVAIKSHRTVSVGDACVNVFAWCQNW